MSLISYLQEAWIVVFPGRQKARAVLKYAGVAETCLSQESWQGPRTRPVGHMTADASVGKMTCDTCYYCHCGWNLCWLEAGGRFNLFRLLPQKSNGPNLTRAWTEKKLSFHFTATLFLVLACACTIASIKIFQRAKATSIIPFFLQIYPINR